MAVVLVSMAIGASAGAAGMLAQSLVDRERGVDWRAVGIASAGGAGAGLVYGLGSLWLESREEDDG